MNLQTLIKPQLWVAISNTYQAGSYSHAVLDAMHHLTQVLRERSGLDGDGQTLVGAALGGQSPVLRVNKLQTQTERDIQKGVEQILRGMYTGIRNPRSHEQVQDTKDTADGIILFINYLLGILEGAKEPFTIQGFLDQVFDTHFVQSTRYAELLVAEVPVGKRLDILIEIYRRKREGTGSNLEYVVKELLKQLPEEQITQFLSVVSEELKTTYNDTDIGLTLQVLPPDLWPRLDEAPRIRTENILIKSIIEGQVGPDGRTLTGSGALGTWARDFLQYFELKLQAGVIILNRLHADESSQRYIFRSFLDVLPSVFEKSHLKKRCIDAIVQAVQNELGVSLIELLRKHYPSLPEDWRTLLDEALPDLSTSADELPF